MDSLRALITGLAGNLGSPTSDANYPIIRVCFDRRLLCAANKPTVDSTLLLYTILTEWGQTPFK